MHSDLCIIEYIWLDDSDNFRSKSRSVAPEYFFPENICYDLCDHLNVDLHLAKADSLCQALQWSYDGSSTGQAHGENSEIILVPVYICQNAFLNHKYNDHNHYLALCQTLTPDLQPLSSNHYAKVKHMIEQAEQVGACFGFEQEFFIMQKHHTNPTQMSGFPVGMPYGNPDQCHHQSKQQYYCGVGAENIHNKVRSMVEQIYHFGLLSGLKLSGINAEVAIGQWEIQVGPTQGIASAHQLWILRYLIKRIAEEYDYCVSLHPKPLGNFNGSGLHANFSDSKMRAPNSYDWILQYITELGKTHTNDMKNYGVDNHLRMTGACETSSYDKFSYGVASRVSSVRIPRNVFLNQSGYIEDRRPASNANPYLIFGVHVPISIKFMNQ